ncbi:MAG: DUF503 domain-containing protein [Desulfobacterota bacterium]|jgi:uncharacterized protein YlxP (DUF503 family)|nr:DUF503 domain-containing protein [Thermodesulfobacteriota bacterium]
MVVGVMDLLLWLPEAHSLKDKRQVVKSLKDRIRNHFNVAVAEVGDQQLWQKAHLGVCTVSADRRDANARLDQVANFVEGLHLAADMDVRIEMLNL